MTDIADLVAKLDALEKEACGGLALDDARAARCSALRDELVPTQWEWLEQHQGAQVKELGRTLTQHAHELLAARKMARAWPGLRAIVVAAQAYVEAFGIRREMDKEGGFSSAAYMTAFAAEKKTRDDLVAAVRGEA